MDSELATGRPLRPLSDRLAAADLSSVDLAALAEMASAEAVRLLGATRAAVWVYRPTLHKLVLPGSSSSPVSLPEGYEIPTDSVDALLDQDGVLRQLLLESFGVSVEGEIAVALPLRISGPPHGLLLLQFSKGDEAAFASDALAFAEQTGAAVANLEALSATRRHERELQALYETAGELSAELDPQIVLQAIVDRARALVGSPVAYITLLDESTRSIYMRVTSGVRRASFQDIRLSLGEGLGGLVAQEWRAIYTSDYLNDARFRHRSEVDDEVRAEGIRSILGVPMRVGGKTIGVLYVANRRVTSFTDADVSLLSSLADHASIAIENARLFEQVSEAMARTDEAQKLVRKQLRRLKRSESVHRQLTELVLAGEGLEAIARTLCQLIGKPVTVADANLRILEASGEPADAFEVRVLREGRIPAECLEDRAFARAFGERRGLHSLRVRPGRPVGSWTRLLTPVVAKGEALGYLLVPLADDEDTGEIEVVLEQGARVAALEMLKERSVAEIDERIRGEFLDELLAQHPPPIDVLRKRGSQVGVDVDRPHWVVLFRLDEPPTAEQATSLVKRRARQFLAGVLRQLAGASFVAEWRKSVVGLIREIPTHKGGSPDPARASTRVKQRIESEEPGTVVTVIVAGPCHSVDDYRREVRLAEQALRLLAELGRSGTVIELGQLGLLPLLLDDRKRPEIEQAVNRALGAILAYDAEHGTQFVGTLEAYFLSLGNVARTAERCHVHPNSVYYRLDRIRELLGHDFEDPEVALDLQVALRARRLLTDGD
jgi:sugar diacid utilization regulator